MQKNTADEIATETGTAQKSDMDRKNFTGFVPYIIAVAILIAYGFFIYYLLGKVGGDEREWSRSIFLFSGVEAIVFAAAGFLFGREVNRKRAENAEEDRKRAEEAKEKAEIKKEEAKEQARTERSNALILGAMAVQEARSTVPGANSASASAPNELSVLEGSKAFDATSAPEGTEHRKTPSGSLAETALRMYPELRGK